MNPVSHVATEDQEFLALLVHRGFLGRAEALEVLKNARTLGSFDRALEESTGWDAGRVGYLRRTRALSRPEIPGYRMEGPLGAGGTSEVFGARRSKDNRHVALKILRPALALDPPAVKRFLAEARLLKNLDHPAIVRGHRVFKFLGTYVLEMDFVPGRTLEEYLAEGQAFAEEQALDIVKQTARALEYLRGEGVLHRDLKPGNLMIDSKGTVKLIDLGFAGKGMEGRADEETTLGTPAYLSPEQARGEADLDVRADIYSLGATLYHLVIGRLPFEGNDDSEVMRRQILDGLSGAALKGRGVSPNLHFLVEKMMAKDRSIRFGSPAELAQAIEAHQERQKQLE